jgi:hypothetical protein
MISMVLVLAIIAALFFQAQVIIIYMYDKTKFKPHLYISISLFFFAVASMFAMLIGASVSINNLYLIKLFGRCSTTSGVLAFVFLNVFAIAMTKNDEKIRGIWISVASYLIILFIIWTRDLFVKGNIGGIPMFTFTSTYKEPYGLPLIEIILASMAVMAIYPAYLFFRVANYTKDNLIKAQSLLLGSGALIAIAGYAIEITGAIPYQYMPIAIPTIMVGTVIIVFGYLLPIQMKRLLDPFSQEMARSFVEKFFVFHVAPTVRTRINSFSKALGINHQQMAGKKILFEFDPASQYEKPIQDLAAEASANAELTIIFTRRGNAIYSSLKELKAVKFFCLTQQVSVPKEFSENEMLLPTKDTSLMLDVFNKALEALSDGNINVVFDSLSDLIMTIGFEKTYRFIRYTIEMLTSPRITVLFLLNQTAHDLKVRSSLSSLFSDQISFGREGMQIVKLSKEERAQVEAKRNPP